MFDHALVCRAVVLQHVLDQVNPATRAVELVAQQCECRTGGRAEPAVNALAQNPFGFGKVTVLQLLGSEIRLHLRVTRTCAIALNWKTES